MKFACVITRLPDGTWAARHESRDVGEVAVQAGSREEAVSKLTGEIRYRLELCPCTGETWQHIDIEIVDKSA
jgi:hypothetical protein